MVRRVGRRVCRGGSMARNEGGECMPVKGGGGINPIKQQFHVYMDIAAGSSYTFINHGWNIDSTKTTVQVNVINSNPASAYPKETRVHANITNSQLTIRRDSTSANILRVEVIVIEWFAKQVLSFIDNGSESMIEHTVSIDPLKSLIINGGFSTNYTGTEINVQIGLKNATTIGSYVLQAALYRYAVYWLVELY